MNHLVLFEAFKSQKISKFSKLTKGTIQEVRFLMANLGINIHQIKDEHVHYVNTRKAADNFKPEDFSDGNNTDNRWIKFWFSDKHNLLAVTKTTNEYLKHHINVDTHLLMPLTRNGKYTDFNWKDPAKDHQKHGFGEMDNNIVCGEIYVDKPYDAIVLLHNNDNYDGNHISDRSYFARSGYSYSWQVGNYINGSGALTDASNLMVFHKEDVDKIIKEKEKGVDTWHEVTNSNIGYNNFEDIFNKSLYALVFDINAIMDDNIPPSKISKKRKEDRQDAYVFKKEYDIKDEYWNKIFKKLMTNYGLFGSGDIKNIKSLLLNILCDEMAFPILANDGIFSFITELNRIVSNISDLKPKNESSFSSRMRDELMGYTIDPRLSPNTRRMLSDALRGIEVKDNGMTEREISGFIADYREVREMSHSIKKNLSTIKNKLGDDHTYDDKTKEWINEIFRISKRITDMVSKNEIETPEQLVVIIQKLKSINLMFRNERVNKISRSDKVSIRDMVESPYVDFIGDVKTLKNFEKNIESLL